MGIRGASYSEYHLFLVYNLLLCGFLCLSASNSGRNGGFTWINRLGRFRYCLLLKLAGFGTGNCGFDGSFARVNRFGCFRGCPADTGCRNLRSFRSRRSFPGARAE